MVGETTRIGSPVTESKGRDPQHAAMATNDNGRADARSRATRRLRNLTIGTTLLSVAATGVLSGAAALTYDGSSSTASTSTSTTALVTNGRSSTSSVASSSTSGTTSTTPSVSSAQGTAHASSGGS
jgi:hypothetical protein